MKYILAALFVCATWCNEVAAKELNVMFGGTRPPFHYIEDGKPKGIEIQLMQALLQAMGHTMKHHARDFYYLEKAIEDGYDISVSVQATKPNAHYSDDLLNFINYSISRKSRRLDITSIKDLTSYKIASWQNAWKDLGPEFESIYKPNPKKAKPNVVPLIEFGDQIEQNRYFWAGKADMILIDKTIFQWMRNKLEKEGVKVLPDSELVYHDLFSRRTTFKVEFKDPQLRDQFNVMLGKIRSNGMYEQIVQSAIR